MRQEKWVRPDCEDPDAGLRPSIVQVAYTVIYLTLVASYGIYPL